MVTNLERPRSALVVLRRVYLNIAQGNHCAAKLIEYFKHWREWKIAHHRTEWIYQPLKRIYEDLMGEHSLHVIRAAIVLLESLGILERRHNPGNGQDKTWQYRLKTDVLEELLNNDAATLNSEQPKNTVEQPPQDPSVSFLATNTVMEEEESVEAVKEAIANSPFMQESSGAGSPPDAKSMGEDKFSAPPSGLKKQGANFNSSPSIEKNENDDQISAFLKRLSAIRIPSTKQVESLVKSRVSQIERNILALEEISATKGLDNPVAAFFAAVKNNWQPRRDKQSWWERAARQLGRERRNRLIAHVTELNRVITVVFANGKRLPLDEAMNLSWNAIAQLGGEP